MKNIKLLSILIIGMVLLFASCKKEEEEKKEDPVPPVVSSGTILKKFSFSDYEYQFEYNSDNQISELKVGLVGESVHNSVIFEYSGNKLLNYTSYNAGEVAGKFVFLDHNEYDKPTKSEVYNGGGGPLQLIAKYDYIYSDGKMIELISKDASSGQEVIMYKCEYYYEGDNVVKQKVYDYNNGSYVLYYIYDYSFDDKNNPAYKFGFIDFSENGIFHGMSVLDINNFTKLELSNESGVPQPQDSYNRVFEYNTDGYPIKCTMKSFDKGEQYTLKYEY